MTHYAFYLTSNTTRVVYHKFGISIVISTKYFYTRKLVQTPVLTANYGESPYKTCLYEEFLNLYGQCTKSLLRSHMDPNVPERLLRGGLVQRQCCRGFVRKGARVLGHNIIVVPNLHQGLKRCSGMLGSISDLNGGSVQWSWLWKYCSFARHHTNLKIPHTNRFCIVTPHSEQ
jgi:hypothetical protein